MTKLSKVVSTKVEDEIVSELQRRASVSGKSRSEVHREALRLGLGLDPDDDGDKAVPSNVVPLPSGPEAFEVARREIPNAGSASTDASGEDGKPTTRLELTSTSFRLRNTPQLLAA